MTVQHCCRALCFSSHRCVAVPTGVVLTEYNRSLCVGVGGGGGWGGGGVFVCVFVQCVCVVLCCVVRVWCGVCVSVSVWWGVVCVVWCV